MDLSKIKCGCAGTIYLSKMNDPTDPNSSNYCDINTNPWCVEVDIFEGNNKGS